MRLEWGDEIFSHYSHLKHGCDTNEQESTEYAYRDIYD